MWTEETHKTLTHTVQPQQGEFPREQYTLDKFAFAWKTIQARTFGRRLPWTALVPFADCLNHANVATKYDFDVDSNGLFRLFPSGANAYAAGTEVFNSYGRRSNFQLLLDYGFALVDNEWDYVDIDLPKDAIGRKFPFLRRLQLDRRSSLDELFPISLLSSLGSLTHAPSATPSETPTSAFDDERAGQVAGYEWLRGVMTTALESFGCSIEDAETQLRQPDLPPRRRDALVYRLSRMHIVAHVIAQIDAALANVKSASPVSDTSAVSEGDAAVSTATRALGSLDLHGNSSSS